jgi:nucleotide-binding universal stress UspA family protein
MESIVIGVDGSETARMAAKSAAELARRYGSKLHVVMAVSRVTLDSMGSGPEAFTISSTALAEQCLLALASDLKADGDVPITTAVVVNDPASALCDEARTIGASVIVVGNKRTQGVARILGSVAGGVVKSAPCAVHIVHTCH